MLNEKMVSEIERQLNHSSELYYTTHNGEIKERNRGYCQGIDAVLSMIGYYIVWDNGKATVVKDD